MPRIAYICIDRVHSEPKLGIDDTRLVTRACVAHVRPRCILWSWKAFSTVQLAAKSAEDKPLCSTVKASQYRHLAPSCTDPIVKDIALPSFCMNSRVSNLVG